LPVSRNETGNPKPGTENAYATVAIGLEQSSNSGRGF
jgi:hypothetical protein